MTLNFCDNISCVCFYRNLLLLQTLWKGTSREKTDAIRSLTSICPSAIPRYPFYPLDGAAVLRQGHGCEHKIPTHECDVSLLCFKLKQLPSALHPFIVVSISVSRRSDHRQQWGQRRAITNTQSEMLRTTTTIINNYRKINMLRMIF